jgi:hypothetical protein
MAIFSRVSFHQALAADFFLPLSEVVPDGADKIVQIEIPPFKRTDFDAQVGLTFENGLKMSVRYPRRAIFEPEEGLKIMRDLKLSVPLELCPPGKPFPKIVKVEFLRDTNNPPFYTGVKLWVVWGEGQEPKPFLIFSNIGGHGAVVLAMCGEKLLWVNQWRVNLGRMIEETPRGFSELWDSGKSTELSTLPAKVKGSVELQANLATALRENEEETGIQFGDVIPHYLRSLYQNSGVETNKPGFWLLELKGYNLKTLPDVRLVTIEEAEDIAEDMHTAAALTTLRSWLRNRDKQSS